MAVRRGVGSGGGGGAKRIAVATSTGSATPLSSRHVRPAPNNFPNANLSAREQADVLNRRAIVQGSDRNLDMLRFPMISHWTFHLPKIALKRRSSDLCPPRTGPSAKLADGRASAIRKSNEKSDPWHARQWRISQNG